MNLTLSSPKPPGTVLQILRANTSARRPSLWFPSNIREYFNGTITDNTFRIHRNIQYRNSFLPVIRGRVEPTESGSEIRLKMSIHPLIKVLMAVWFTGVVLACLETLLGTIAGDPIPPPSLFGTWGMLLFGILLAIVPFRIEAKKAQEKLESLFQ
jgi:hypothetical protein